MKFIPMLLSVLMLPALAQTKSAVDPMKRLEEEALARGQRAAAETIEPNEIEAIKARRILMGRVGLQMYVVLLSKSGQPIDYFVTTGKCVSSEKRLTPGQKLVDVGPNSLVLKAPSEDGTHGSSSPYIYCKTVDGRYRQWNGSYYASDKPIELTVKPLVVQFGTKIQGQQ